MEIGINNASIKLDDGYMPIIDFSYLFSDGCYGLLADEESVTKLFDIVAGISGDYSGSVTIGGRDRKDTANKNLRISYLKREPVLLMGKSVYENIKYVFSVSGDKIGEKENAIIDKLLTEFGLMNYKFVKAKKLDGDLKFALCLVRVLIKKSDIVLIERVQNADIFKKFLKAWRNQSLGEGKHSGGVLLAGMTQNWGYFDDGKILKFCFGRFLGEFCCENELKNPSDIFSYFYAKKQANLQTDICGYDGANKFLMDNNWGGDVITVDGFKFDSITGMRAE